MSKILRAPKGAIRKPKRVGRGNASGWGSTSGKGNNGQNARAGGGVKPGFEGGQMVLYRRIPRRGFSNSPFRKDFVEVDLFILEKHFNSNDIVSVNTLKEKKLIRKNDKLVKIISRGDTKKSFTIEGISLTKGAKEKLSGSIIKIKEKKIKEKKQNKE